MVIGNADGVAVATNAGANNNSNAHPSGIPQDKIDNIMSGIANTGDVKMNNHRKKLRQRFDIIKKLGQGTYGKVQLGINKETGQEVAIKTIKKCKIEAEADLVRIRREVQIMSSVQHPNIIHIYEVFENREKMVLVMEFAAGGELYDYLSERKVLSEIEARRIFRQVATAVYYCHKHKICHRDLKLENILLDEQGNAKIADFGLSNVFDDQRLLATFCGSPLYASPEIVEGTPYHGPEVDCWSLGVLLYTLVYGSMPFDGSNFKRLVKQISEGDYFEPKKPSRASTLIRDMLTVCPRKRATIEQICSHWWVNENDNLSCLDLAEDLANQTPVRLDVLLSLTPAAITADQLVVPSADGGVAAKGAERVPRSHSVGSIRDIGANTEAERRILDMVAAGGEAALMPSPTRTITPAQSPIQPKRKLETTQSTENASGAVKKEKAGSKSVVNEEIEAKLTEETPMETDEVKAESEHTEKSDSITFTKKDISAVADMCSKLMDESVPAKTTAGSGDVEKSGVTNEHNSIPRQRTSLGKLDSVAEAPEEKEATKVIKKFVNKHKTADLLSTINQANDKKPTEGKTTTAAVGAATTGVAPFVRKCSLQDETSLNKFNAERRKSRILETAEKFNQMNANTGTDKTKKLVIPGVSVGSFKKEFERKASTPAANQGPTAGERRAMEEVAAAAAAAKELEEAASAPSISSFVSLEDDMENKTANEIDQLCAKTENFGVNEEPLDPYEIITERERKLQNARNIIGNAIQPVIRRPTPSVQLPTTPLAQPQPPTSSVFGSVGGGGIGQILRSGMFGVPNTVAGCSGGASSLNGNHNNNNNNNKFNSNCQTNKIIDDNKGLTVQVAAAPTTTTTTTASSSPSSSWLKWPNIRQKQKAFNTDNNNNNHNTAAIAAARHNIMSKLASASAQIPTLHSLNMNSQTTAFDGNKIYNDFNQQQVPERCPQQQSTLKSSQLNKVRQLQRHISVPPLPSAALSCYTNANASAATPNYANAGNANKNSVPKPFYSAPPPPTPQPLSTSTLYKCSPGSDPNAVKTSSASITLKSATLPRRKTAKTEIQLEIKPRPVEKSPMRFTTEMQHPMADLRSAPARDGPMPFSPVPATNARAASLEPKEHIIPIQRPPTYTRTTSNTTTRSSGSLSRQSTGDSESDTNTTTANMSQSTVTGSSQPIKKSPREFIIPIAVEGGGIITPREGSIEPSESAQTANSSRTFNRIRPTRRIGSLLSNAGVGDEESPFPKMRTSSNNRDSEDDPRFTLHRLRSSKPMKKVSQDNDSGSSAEEDDDDDGFEILTAENLFSTLLQRVRALTNRINVNNDITSGFPNSSNRLFNNMRSGQSSFWNQDPFRSTQVSYTFSETVEKKQVRLNNMSNNMGAPWRHSMAGRDLDTDMDSIFSRTGATLPRGTKPVKANRSISNDANKTGTPILNTQKSLPNEPMDLADLDLSRLRLSKKDLETLSNIAPGLPKCFQEQLLAKLPPTQARKLSRTLSMQNKAATSVVPLYKRSQSSGRGMEPDLTTTSEEQSNTTGGASSSRTSDESGGERNLQRRSISRSRYDYESGIPAPVDTPTNKSRSNSVSREDFNRTPYTSEVSEKYKYYSPYLSKHAAKENETVLSRKQQSDNNVVAASLRPPSGSTATADNNGSLRRRATQRRISRFLRPDFYEEPLEESAYLRERKSREREAQSVLREIREKSLERSCEPVNQTLLSPDAEAIVPQHVRNKSLELFSEDQRLAQEIAKRQRRSLSRPREIVKQVDKKELADKILQELQVLSAARNEQECLTNGYELPEEKTATIKKVKKVKSKSNAEAKLKEDTHKAVKQLKPEVENNALDTLKKESKLKRPKSYPLKDFGTTSLQKTELIGYSALKPANRNSKLPISIPECEKCEQAAAAGLPAAENANTMLRESRLMRPKSYPATKLTHPQQLKNVTTVNETTAPDDKSLSLTPSGKCSGGDNSSSSDSRTTSVKKVTKVTKKSKLALPTSLASNGDIDKLHKEKSPEKKPRGLLYAIGQKFEKLRDSTKSKEKKSAVNSTTDITKISTSATCLAANKSGSSSESSSPEKIKQKTLLKKKKTVTDSLPPKAEKADHHAENKISNHTEKVAKPDKRSRLDAMWRTLRERSLPRLATPTKDASYLKRAISVEEMQGNVNRTAVSKVLGLFKRADKDAGTMRNVRSTSNIERKVLDSPESPIYQNTAVMDTYTPVARHAKGHDNFCDAASCSYVESLPTTPASLTCPDCIQDEAVKQQQLNKSRHEETNHLSSNYKENMPLQTGNKDKRKGLILELNKSSDNMKFTGKNTYMNSNGIYANLPPYPISLKNSSQQSSSLHSIENTLNTKTNYANNNSSFNNNNNNNINNNSSHTTSGYHTSSTHEVNRNHLLTPSNENIANYSSDSRSYHDDCASNSTFLSPTEEAELSFDNWSVCSEDNYTRHATPSPTVSRLSRASQRSSPTRNGDTSDANESVIDRIKRRSFYCRFNDKKPKRTSSIVGPNAVRDYYREQQAAVKARSNNKLHLETHTDRAVSPDITQEFFRPLKLSPVGSELKPPIYRSPLDYSMSSSAATANRQRKSLNELRPLTTPNTVNTPSYAGRRYAGANERSSDYLSGLSSNSASIRYKPPVYESPGVHSSSSSNYYNSYNPKRRSSYTLNGSLPNGGNHIDGYATLGRRSVRAYDQRTHSMHDTPISECSGVNNYRRDARTPVRDYSSGVLRSNSRYRATSGTRSPTNI